MNPLPGMVRTVPRSDSSTATTVSEPESSKTQPLALLVGSTLLAVPTFCVAVAVVGFAFGRGVGPLTLPLAVISTVGCTALASFHWLPRHRLASALIALTVTAVVSGTALVTSLVIWDTTWDGQWFHQEAVLQLEDGWNPWERPLTPQDVPGPGGRARINGYPAASWMYGSAIVAVTDRLATGKALSPVLIVASFFLAAAALLDFRRLPPGIAWACALLLSLNPVALTQSLNFQHDGDLVSVLLAATATGFLAVRRGWPLAMWGLAMSSLLIVGLKFTGPPYLALLLATLGVAHLLLHRRLPRRRALAAAVLAAVAVVATGYHPYVTNSLRFEHPLYPHAGPRRDLAHDVDERGTLTPPRSPPDHDRSLLGRPLALLLSAFSRSSHSPNSIRAYESLMRRERLKIPFTVTAEERRVFILPDVRIGGWGPLFGGMLLVGLFGALAAGRSARRMLTWLPLATGTILISALLLPDPWFARYTPQIWWLPFLLLPVAYASRSPTAKLAGLSVLAVALVNVAVILPINVQGAWSNTISVKSRLLDVARGNRPPRIDLSPFRSYRARLSELGIQYVEVQDRRFSLGVPVGYFSIPDAQHRLVGRPAGGSAAVLRWNRMPHATHYRVQVVEPPPRGPGGGALTVVERRCEGSIIEAPVPVGVVHLLLSACNRLGCGPPRFVTTLEVPPPPPPRPIFGSPAPGTTVLASNILFSWIPVAEAEESVEYRLTVRSTTAEAERVEVRTTTDEHFWTSTLSAGKEYVATLTAFRAGKEIGADTLHFRTEPPVSPRPTTPAMGSTLTEGSVVLAWTPLPGATRYEYYVSVQGDPDPHLRGTTVNTSVTVDLQALEDGSTTYSVTVRACTRPRCAEDRDWGPWSIQSGTGVTNFTVNPASP